MIFFILILANVAFAGDIGPQASPVFLKYGFSSILEFEEAPTEVVLGDQNLFQVEKLNKSIVIKPLAEHASTNMFVYFRTKPTRLFILSASDDNQPTYYRKFTSLVPPPPKRSRVTAGHQQKRGVQIRKSSFDTKKDYLTVDFEISADAKSKVIPSWNHIGLKYKNLFIKPSKLWSERREAQKDSKIKARLVFTKPNIPANLKRVALVVPIKDSKNPFTVNLKVGR